MFPTSGTPQLQNDWSLSSCALTDAFVPLGQRCTATAPPPLITALPSSTHKKISNPPSHLLAYSLSHLFTYYLTCMTDLLIHPGAFIPACPVNVQINRQNLCLRCVPLQPYNPENNWPCEWELVGCANCSTTFHNISQLWDNFKTTLGKRGDNFGKARLRSSGAEDYWTCEWDVQWEHW